MIKTNEQIKEHEKKKADLHKRLKPSNFYIKCYKCYTYSKEAKSICPECNGMEYLNVLEYKPAVKRKRKAKGDNK